MLHNDICGPLSGVMSQGVPGNGPSFGPYNLFAMTMEKLLTAFHFVLQHLFYSALRYPSLSWHVNYFTRARIRHMFYIINAFLADRTIWTFAQLKAIQVSPEASMPSTDYT